jgi:DNA helicase-4
MNGTCKKYIEYSKLLDHLYNGYRYVSYNDHNIATKEYIELDITWAFNLRLIIKLLLRFQLIKAYITHKAFINIRLKNSYRERYNKKFILSEQEKEYISGDQKLDKQQIEAVVSCEDANLVLAPAGSGKTLSLTAKIEYIVNTLHVEPNRVLAISFTKKTVDELKNKIGINGVNINTFHSLGNKILKSQTVTKLKLIQEKQIQKFLKDTVDYYLDNDEKFAEAYNNYLLFYYSTPIDLTEIKTLKDKVEFNKSFLRQSLQSITLDKSVYDKSRPTLNNEFIRSKEEQIIANWLFINQIPYEYEKQYEFVDTKYKPDFTITLFDDPIYLEHFALRKDGTSHYRNYVSGVDWKRKVHKQNNTRLIESYTYQWLDGTLLTHIEKQIKLTGNKLTRLSEKEIHRIMTSSKQYNADIKSFQEMIYNFLSLQKNGMLTPEDIKGLIAKLDNNYLKRRAELFYEIFEPIYNKYTEYLNKNHMIDFADMINKSIEVVGITDDFNDSFDYILIDEVQDLSSNRYQLVKSLIKKSPNSKLFAVGDDWQSIFRFAGGDLSLIQDFENTFELTTYRSYIGMTHRFGEPQLSLSSVFVQKNPHQSQKVVFSSKNIKTPVLKRLYKTKIASIRTEKTDPQAEALDSILKNLVIDYGKEIYDKKIQIISRYNSDINVILGDKKRNITRHKNFTLVTSDENEVSNKNEKEIIIDWKSSKISSPIKISFCSMHKAKGITRDIVIILNMNAGNNGMPALRTSDPLIELLLAHSDQFPFAEERRLFYVAITRAKLATYLIADRSRPSQFMFEVFDDLFGSNNTCPNCKIGEIVDRNGPYGQFKGCSNFKYGCDLVVKL